MSELLVERGPGTWKVQSLDVDALPRGQKSRLMLELVHDGMGRPLSLPVLAVRGAKPGPVFGVTAAVHGNELNGIPVIHRLIDRLDPKRLHGSIVAVPVVNVPGYLANTRQFEGVDLNHIMPGRPNGNASEVYAHRLLTRVIAPFNYLVDLHTASFGRVNSLYIRADMSDETTARMAHLHRPQIIVHNPPSDHTLRGAAAERGIPAVTVEIGNPQIFQQEYIRNTLIGLRSVLSEAGMVPKRQVSPGVAPIICQRSGWIYTDAGGLLEVLPRVTELVKEGEVIARLSNLFGDVIREYKAPHDGVVIGKSVNPVAQTGARVVHLGTLAEPDSNLFLERGRPLDTLKS